MPQRITLPSSNGSASALRVRWPRPTWIAALAELTGYSEAQIVSWERGRARLYPIELIKLCHALDVMPEWLLCWERRPH